MSRASAFWHSDGVITVARPTGRLHRNALAGVPSDIPTGVVTEVGEQGVHTGLLSGLEKVKL